MLDAQSGERRAGGHVNPSQSKGAKGALSFSSGRSRTVPGVNTYSDSGGASRFFYTAKTSRSDRDRGCEALSREALPEQRKGSGVKNHHPTVKPLALMRWLVRLITPPGGVVLDPFAGSGSTGMAALEEGCRFVGVEREAEYAQIARARIGAGQRGLFEQQPEQVYSSATTVTKR